MDDTLYGCNLYIVTDSTTFALLFHTFIRLTQNFLCFCLEKNGKKRFWQKSDFGKNCQNIKGEGNL